jgi:hypothetical protein
MRVLCILALLTIAGTAFAQLSAGKQNVPVQDQKPNLNLSADGLQLTGTMSHLVSYESAVMPFTLVGPVTLFATSAAGRTVEAHL